MKIIGIILSVLLGLFCWYLLNKNIQKSNEISDYITYQDSLKKVIETKNGTIYIQDQYIVDSKKELDKLTEEIKGIKKISSQTKIKQIVEIIRDTLVVSDTIIVRQDNKNYLQLPFFISDNNEWYDLKITIDTLGQSVLDYLKLSGDITHTVGIEDKGFFKNIFTKNDIVVAYKSNNPYFRAEGINSYSLNTDKKISLGLQVGYYLTKDGFQPGIGAGVSYKIIDF